MEDELGHSHNVETLVLSSAQSHIPHHLDCDWPSASHQTMVLQPELREQWQEGTRRSYCWPSTHTPGASRKSLSLASCSQSVWYYSQLNEGFIEATWIKRATATMYLLLCNAVNRFAEWGFNVFLYTSRTWNVLSVAEPRLKWQVGHWDAWWRLCPPPPVIFM